ncbi:hypothetical protein Cme02nite_16160 [Catellatospora methionotrophica]|uniref:Uncharacterized protein n=1 Tax=Catellatospora methionotrophica TaxID=121620 RepID=A0A8J3LCU6_9ACTN|nr:hypothetical protein Cme02nite_16160 [Catellatospora methionotrophica]
MRITAPIRFGSATSQNFWSTVNGKAAAGIATTTTLQSVHTEKPRCSAKMEKTRFRRATRRPVEAQNCGSSGSQVLIAAGFVAGGAGALAVMANRLRTCDCRVVPPPLPGM